MIIQNVTFNPFEEINKDETLYENVKRLYRLIIHVTVSVSDTQLIFIYYINIT